MSKIIKKKTVITAKKKTAGAQKKVVKKAGRRRPPVNAGRLKEAAMMFASFAEAEGYLALKKSLSLAEIIEKYPTSRQAWDRGRLIRSIGKYASQAVSVAEAERGIGLADGELVVLLATDSEIADTWNEKRLDFKLSLREALTETAIKGNQNALKHIEEFLSHDIEQTASGGTAIDRVSLAAMASIAGVTTITIRNWVEKNQMPRNKNGTYNLIHCWRWSESFYNQKLAVNAPPAPEKTLADVRILKYERELAIQDGELLDRNTVIAGLTARMQVLVAAKKGRNPELGMLCENQPHVKVTEILDNAADDLMRKLIEVPEFLKLPPEAAELFSELMESLVNF